MNRLGACEPASVLDLGCGPGNSTAIVRARYPKARVVGLDSSAEMIERAQRDFPQGEWLLADASVWSAPEPYDVVFSNATLQWIPDHKYRIMSTSTGVCCSRCTPIRAHGARS